LYTYVGSPQRKMNFLALLLFIGSLLETGSSANFGPKSLSQDPTKVGEKWLNAGSDEEGRIVGGEQAGMKDAPWQVSLRNFLVSISHFCGGSIIAPKWVLTAAHCLDGLSTLQYEVMAGEHNLHLPDLHEEVRRVRAHFIHPNYTWNDKEFDIGLVRLNSAFKFTEYIQPISLHNGPSPAEGLVCEATGWGITEEGGMFLASILQKVSLPVVGDTLCTEEYGYLMRENMLCAGEEGKDSCSGDSGGPLVCPLGDGSTPVLAGVTSWGQGCGRPGKPGVYTEVSYFYDWIQKTIAEYDNS